MAVNIKLVFTGFLIYCYGCRIVAGNATYKSLATKHPDVYRAKSHLDSLMYKLQLDLEALNEKESLASDMQNDAKRLAEIAKNEMALLNPIRQLLEALTEGNTSFRYRDGCLVEPRKIRVRIETGSSILPEKYTISVAVNHREWIDRGITQETGDDIQVFYQAKDARPKQIDRVISGLGTTNATVHFRLQAPITANTVAGASYSLRLGQVGTGSTMDNPDNVYCFHDDFSTDVLNKDWANNWGEWKVMDGRLYGKTMETKTGDRVEIGLYLQSGFQWKDIEVELDMMETGSADSAPGPFLRVRNVNPSRTTGWWFEYYPISGNHCIMRPQKDNKDSDWKYNATLPATFKLNTWYHMSYQLKGDRFSYSINGKSVQTNVQVNKEWMIPAGTLGFGCHNVPNNCQTFYDNIKVRLLVSNPPKVTLGNLEPIFMNYSPVLGDRNLPADSCKQIHDASLTNNGPRAKNGLYWIKTDFQASSAVKTYCDMSNGGWTLVGKISGGVGAIYKRWLVSNFNTAALQSPKITANNKFACLDARSLAVEQASAILLSSADRTDGLGSKWVKWRLPENREKDLFWNHAVGKSEVDAAVHAPVMVYAWNGNKKICYQNNFGIMAWGGHGGSYPSTSFNTAGNTATNDYCMAVGVMTKGSTAHGWSQNGYGYDSPTSDSDWPNRLINHQTPHLTVWLK